MDLKENYYRLYMALKSVSMFIQNFTMYALQP
jgi:hypothetical protein